MKKAKDLAVCAVFFLALFLIPIVFFLSPDQEFSAAERRKLAQAPAFTVQGWFQGRYQTEAEEYALDQFPARESFRAVKAFFNLKLLGRTDYNDVYPSQPGDPPGHLFKLYYPLKESQVRLTAKKLRELQTSYLSGSACYYAVIPDKNEYSSLAALAVPHSSVERLLEEELPAMTGVPLSSALSLEDYYRTDLHWRQEKLFGVTGLLAEAMGFPAPREQDFTPHILEGFQGAYAARYPLAVKPDRLTYLSSDFTESAAVLDHETGNHIPVYDPAAFTGRLDPYDLYLGGAKALLTISTGADTGRELLLFRDSFGSPLAPLLFSSYDTITLIDLRYLSTQALKNYVNFHGQDALFLYSVPLWNSGGMFR